MNAVLSPATAARLKEVLAHRPGLGEGVGGAGRPHFFIYVEVTGAADADGFHQCLPTRYVTDEAGWAHVSEDDTDTALGIEANGGALATGKRYLAMSAGDTEGGDAVFVVLGDCCEPCASEVLTAGVIFTFAGSWAIPLSEEVGAINVVGLTYTVGLGITPPAGWTVVYDGTAAVGSAGKLWVGYRVVAAAGEGSTFTVIPSAGLATAAAAKFFSIGNAIVEGSATADVTSAAFTAPSVTSLGAGRRLAVFGLVAEDPALGYPANYAIDPPAGMATFGGTNADPTLHLWEEDVDSGATGTRTVALTGSRHWNAVSLVLGVGEGQTGSSWEGDSVVCGKVVALGAGPASIDGIPIGAVTPSSGAFTTVTATTPVAPSSGGTGLTSLFGNGPPGAGIGQTGSIYFDVLDPANVQFYYRT